jgi:hypothetical protein
MAVLVKIEILSPDIQFKIARVHRPVTPMQARSVHPLAPWELQAHAQSLKRSHPTAATKLSAALEALLNGYSLARMLLLTRILGRHTEQIATKLKANAVPINNPISTCHT